MAYIKTTGTVRETPQILDTEAHLNNTFQSVIQKSPLQRSVGY
jgi:hypothetical protein